MTSTSTQDNHKATADSHQNVVALDISESRCGMVGGGPPPLDRVLSYE